MTSALPIYLMLGTVALITAPISVLVSRPINRIQWRCIGAAFAVFGVSGFFLVIPFVFPALQIGNTNWTGKLLSIVATYAIILSRAQGDPARKFITLTQTVGSGRRSAVIILLLLLLSAVLTVFGGNDGRPPATWEMLSFEATLPGIDEEAVFRAAFLGYLLAAVRNTGTHFRWQAVGAVLTSAVLFGLLHAVTFDASLHLHFDTTAFVITGTFGAGFAVLALNSGSILLPIIVHNLSNCVGFL
jgi:membrane protease YdiL (CAAX protease family)